MKNLKISLMAFMALFLGIGLASCGDDKDEPVTETTIKTDVTANVLMTEDLANYFDGKLTITLNNVSTDYTLKKSDGTVMKVNDNYNAYLFKVVVEDVEIPANQNKYITIKGTLTYTRNETAQPTTKCDFLEQSYLRFTAPKTYVDNNGKDEASCHIGIDAGTLDRVIKPSAVTRTTTLTYYPDADGTFNYSDLISRFASSLETYNYTYSY